MCVKGETSESHFGRKEGEVWFSWEKFRPTSPSSLTPALADISWIIRTEQGWIHGCLWVRLYKDYIFPVFISLVLNPDMFMSGDQGSTWLKLGLGPRSNLWKLILSHHLSTYMYVHFYYLNFRRKRKKSRQVPRHIRHGLSFFVCFNDAVRINLHLQCNIQFSTFFSKYLNIIAI
jgi:hypothetical protein